MKLAVGSDEQTHLTDAVAAELQRRGHVVELYGTLAGQATLWPEVGRQVAVRVAGGDCDEGILFCWTGTGVSIVANKVPGIRAALCVDGPTAAGARRWNHANILVMSLRLASEAVACEILDAWFSTPFGVGEDAECVRQLAEIEERSGVMATRR